jgi:hypothetical protein
MKDKTRLMNPFPGLRSFRSDEDYLFFGREEQTQELMARLEQNRFIAVVGTSGRGKSSLVRCGLLSRLQGGGMVGAGAHWEIAVMHPGGDPPQPVRADRGRAPGETPSRHELPPRGRPVRGDLPLRRGRPGGERSGQ